MKKGGFTEAQIIGSLREQETGGTTDAVCRQHGISQQTVYRGKAKYGGLEVSDAQKLKALEDENRRLKKLLAELMPDVAALKDLLGKTDRARGAPGGRAPPDGRASLLAAARLRAHPDRSQDPAPRTRSRRRRAARAAAEPGGGASAAGGPASSSSGKAST